MRIHFVAICRSALPNLADAFFCNGSLINNPGDEVFEFSGKRTEDRLLLPEERRLLIDADICII